ncbi:Bug family tripartite tricarboxylate transporter substrate binding protein [Verminephrobacter eiseniae]|uniref:Bug family tripartite tricarboxylate transporter substrate binding protein n=1 Tax=Verminephrobacter eiseniae TaxID=364317 RepID=UPI0022374C3E|nr:tripartite tricarboxylate transporter substrate binding protein [Verminephrobacter eiseniae]MCW5232968.1 tripartite tricarboxylate transporter substrate binding protein [Verminephrobacter eiseniae]MCW5295476.1 tripartite tricarboxylate transporter substrate binding protein [Verminephrobacter eiseniae]MCW8187453.1 tripartite tricarboxylate transporter substrate binding protein [Verminephrobacter eiseniae]MCW8225783.1 tripartite tricarboxylate transporter substrate binding protein [Verminephro
MPIRVQSLACAALLALGAALASGATAQSGTAPSDKASHWPSKPVTLVIPYPPGGTSDIVGRQLADRLREELGQTIVVENKAGAATAIGATAVARAAKDGHTLLLSASSTFTVAPHLSDKLQYKFDDFAPVAPVSTTPFVLVVRKDFPARNLREFAAYAQVNPGKVNNATNGQGGLGHLLGELVATGLGVQLTQVHYKGAVPAAMDLIGGIVDSNVQALTNAVPNVNAGQYRALAVLSAERQPLLPQVPTFKELGYPQIVGDAWYAVFAPAGTPKPVLDKLGAAIRKITGSARFGAAMRKVGNQAQTGTPEQLRELTLQQSRRWGDLIRQHGIEAE